MSEAPAPLSAAPGRLRLERWTVTAGSNVISRAAVVLSGGGQDWQATAEGTGAVDALYKAIDAALEEVIGGNPLLLAYDVHALAQGPSAKGQVTVRIAPPAGTRGDRADGRFSGEVASANTIAASVEAYVEALNAMLGAASWAGATDEAAAARGMRRSPDGARAELVDEVEPIDTTEWFNR